MRDRVAVAVKDAGERSSIKAPPLVRFVDIRSDDSLVENLSAGEVRVQVDVGGQDEVLVVIIGIFAEGDQIGGRSDLVRVVRLTCTAAVFGVCRHYKQTRDQG